MSNDSSILQMEGEIISRTFSPAFVVLSYVASWIGAWTTLELINKRTAGRGLYNWYLLVGSSISMGGISIFSMHYLGNRAIVLGDGNILIQIAYSPAFTALSMFVPIVVLLAAFVTIGSNEKVSWLRVSLGGALAGLAILGMHYLGQAGISNYSVEYMVGNVVGSGIIAVGATVTALSVFFLLRASWTASWWKRALTAVLLAGAVSGMHWVAEVGTQYRLKQVDPSANQSRDSTVIVVIVLSVAACSILIIFSLLAQRRRAKSANRAQQVVLAAAIFDKDGRLLVTPEGLLPSQKITNSYIERSFEEIFGISHPVFLWIFRISRNWSAISGLLPAMRHHIDHSSTVNGYKAATAELKLGNDSGEAIEDYSVIFRELFCIAAAELAEQLSQPLDNVGVLFDEILSTGQKGQYRPRGRKSSRSGSVDVERDGVIPQIFGRGQLLFLTKSASPKDVENLQNAGFRFAGIHNVVDILARSMQINSFDLGGQLINMWNYSKEMRLLEPGVHMGYFAVRANVGGGFDVLVRKDVRNQLPSMQLPLVNLDTWQLSYLAARDGISMSACLKSFNATLSDPSAPKKEQTFARQLHDTLEALRDEIDDSSFMEALLVGKPVSAPCRGIGEDAKPSQAPMIAFRSMIPIHSRTVGRKLEFIPFSFFNTQQHVYKNSSDHGVFARRVHREFGEVLAQSRSSIGDKETGLLSPNSFRFGGSNRSLSDKGPPSPNSFELRNHKSINDIRDELEYQLPTLIPRAKVSDNQMSIRFWNRGPKIIEPSSSRMSARDDASSENNLVEPLSFGGILVSQEVTVDVQEVGSENATKGTKTGLETLDLKTRRGVEAPNKLKLGPLAAASTEEDPETYVDSLFAICVETR